MLYIMCDLVYHCSILLVNRIQMVADLSRNEKNCGKIVADEAIVGFLRDNPSRILIVDFLNIMIGGIFGARDLADLCKKLEPYYPAVPMVIVTKKVTSWPNIDADTAEMVTKKYSNVLILVCDAQGAKKKQSPKTHSAKYISLAQADDHLISLLALVISSAGCGPMILSEDKFRDSCDVFKMISRYEYTAYRGGSTSSNWIEPGHMSEWIYATTLAVFDARIKCGYILAGRCKNCKKRGKLTCVLCGVCITCNIDLVSSVMESGQLAMCGSRLSKVSTDSPD
jgi:hypothetical protein